MRIRLDLVTRNMEKAPCGVKCDVCERYRADKCVGCPATRHYKGLREALEGVREA